MFIGHFGVALAAKKVAPDWRRDSIIKTRDGTLKTCPDTNLLKPTGPSENIAANGA